MSNETAVRPDAEPGTQPPRQRRGLHPAWTVAATALVVLLGAAGIRSAPGLLIDPLHSEFGWSRGTISSAVSVNLLLYGLTSPFAAALMERFGMRRVAPVALLAIAAGSGLTVFMTQSWQLVLLWGVLVGLGAGSLSMAFVATVTGRWFAGRQGLVTGVLTASSAAGNLVFLPVLGALITHHGWRTAATVVACCALAVAIPAAVLLREHPRDKGVLPYGATQEPPPPKRAVRPSHALHVLRTASRTRVFWLLAGGFAICGASTSGLIATDFVPAAQDCGMPMTTAAGLLSVIGIFDLVGTIGSGWLTDRVDPKLLLGVYYTLRGASLFLLPMLLGPTVHATTLVFVVFYGLDWVATVPPTVALCRRYFGEDAAVVFGWTFAAHQAGAAVVAAVAGVVRDSMGTYAPAFYGAGVLCAFAAVMSVMVRGRTVAAA
ncbi:MFS transporter [Mangrovactinospora gilvigrisea]|uniref:MFS transporter n=1 Tax=Mangrovactinospora gilvigrisea TaxID=1428644 RepID=A0A1J7BJP8_9ACTN|nr:MFS transporter [Mangrovactinospora gilvigrisea]OIV38813.1 MFS transporter [Mangrovactinospora gilvigrisea]